MPAGAQFTFSAATQSRILRLGHGATHSGLPAPKKCNQDKPMGQPDLTTEIPFTEDSRLSG